MNLAVLAEQSAERLGEHLALEIDGHRFTNWQILDRGKRLHAAFSELGMKRGSRAVVLMMNHPLQYPIMQGIFRTGGTAVPVMPQAAAAELRYILADTEAAFVIADLDRVPTVREAAAGLTHVRGILAPGAEDDPQAAPAEMRLESLLDYAPRTELPAIGEEDVAVMLYSSGTTGRPKGVLLTHGNLLAGAEAVSEASMLDSWQGPRVTLSAMPIAHIFGVAIMNDLLMTPKHLADKTHLVQMKWFEPERFMALVQEHRCSTTAAVPTILAVLLHHPKAATFDLTSLSEIICGGAPLPVELAQAFMRRYPARIREVYGLTECTGMGSANRRTDPFRPGSAGRAYCNTELAIFDEHDAPLGPHQRGEICLRGRTVMKGYHNRPDETAQTIRDGWLHTGDVGYLDEDGYLYVVDRMKDMIIRGGENIYPAELEAVLHEHPAVAEAAVVGVPDEVYGENVVAFVVAKPGAQVAEAEIIEHVCTLVARFKAPSRVHFVQAIPKSNIGKILRRVLREKAAPPA
ncbi:MAG: AMP-binding protein [Planctomycetia bacterium]|nr:AMP-binding protein [Planctomycetia bacterium]